MFAQIVSVIFATSSLVIGRVSAPTRPHATPVCATRWRSCGLRSAMPAAAAASADGSPAAAAAAAA